MSLIRVYQDSKLYQVALSRALLSPKVRFPDIKSIADIKLVLAINWYCTKPAQYGSKIRHPLHQIKLNGVSCLWTFSNYHPSFTGFKVYSTHEPSTAISTCTLVCCCGRGLWELMDFQRLIFENRTKMRNKQLWVFRNQKCNHACWRLYKRFHRHRTQRKMGIFHW